MSSWWMTILFFLPAGIANATPVVANRIPLLRNWKTPIDFGISIRSKRLFGKNKTWRGMLTGSVIAGLSALLLSSFINYDTSLTTTFGLGFIMGFGALFGDALESSIKRQRGIPSGNRWFPFDQIDYIIGGLLFVAPFTVLTWNDVGLIFVTYFGLHLIVAYLAYLLGLKDKPI